MNNNNSQLKAGAILSYLQMALSIAISLVYTPMMLRLLGQSEYGLYNIASSSISMLGLLSFGLNSGYVRYFAKYKVQNDKESIAKLNGLYLILFAIIGLVGLLAGLFLSFNLELVFENGLTAREYATARILMIMLTINLAFMFPASVLSSIISANEQYVFLKVTGMITTIISPLVTVPLLLAGFRSIALVAVSVTLSFVSYIVQGIFVFRVLKQRFVFHDFEKGILRTLFTYCGFITINMIVNQINSEIDKLILARFCGTEAVAVYSVGYGLYNHYVSFSTSVSGVFAPRIHTLVAQTQNDLKEQRRLLTDIFTKVGRIQFAILALLATGLVFFGKPFIVGYWAGPGYEDAYVVILLLALSVTTALIQNIGIEIQRAQNRHQFRSIAYFIMALLNLGMSIVLCQKYGVIGCTIGTAASYIIANGVIMNIYYHKKCNINILAFWKSILNMFEGLVVPILAGTLIMTYVRIKSLLSLIVWILIYTLIYIASMYQFALNKYERTLMTKPMKRIIRGFINEK